MMSWHWDGGWTPFGMIHMLIWWIFAILVIALLVKLVFGDRRKSDDDRALSILRERYARGEIDKEEFDARKHELGK